MEVCFFKTLVVEGDWGLCAPQAHSLQLQLRGNTGKRCLDVPSVIIGVLEGRRLTALRGADMSIQMIAGSYRQLCTQVLFFSQKQTSQTGLSTLQLCGGFQ